MQSLIDRPLSASQINRFRNEPALWILDRFYGVKGEMGPGAARGKAVEAGLVVTYLHNADFDKALDESYRVFDADVKGELGEKVEKERGIIAPMLEQAIALFKEREFGPLIHTQRRIELDIEGCPVIGFVDFDFEHCCPDLKTANRMPSFDESGHIKDKDDHLLQVALYREATKKPQGLAYVTPKKAVLYDPTEEELDAMLRQAEASVRAMRRAVMHIETGGHPQEIAELYPPRNMQNFVWDEVTRDAARNLWRL